MNQGRKYLFVIACAALGFIAYRTQGPARETTVTDITVNGLAEYHTRAHRLSATLDGVEWSAVALTDPTKPELVVNFRNVGTPREAWEAATLKPIAFVVDGRSYDLSPYQALRTVDGESIAMVNVKGTRSTLESVVAAKSAQMEFGGQRHEIGDMGLGLETLRELWQRSSPTGSPKR